MLDTTTKQKIDSLRNLLVGKVPDPKSQVEQITVALFYKFMWDRDKEIKDLGGNATFFVGEFEKYSWENLFAPDLGGSECIKLYSEAIEEMENNPNIPSIFRDIFKRAFLPYNDPYTLRLFLKEINDFHYSNSEKLGDGFEYLLSILGTQGDAGQFRTPRHIIDFITEVVNPKKGDRIVDPACGTAGFIISAYKHILKTNTKESLGDLLTPEDKKRLGNNLVGLDIDPMMVKLALANMYLHGLNEPHIYEYDSLTSEDRWDDMFDVVLANPPFMTPSGGIRPHKRFAVNATKAEVLFTSYINTHLSNNGRAGVVVPEGLIFVGENAYKELRKQLIESSLIGVVSLPQGVFNPYSPVKTSILILDKELNKKTDKIFFFKVENDGFSLGKKRKEIDKNDLPRISKSIKKYCDSLNGISEADNLNTLSKYDILSSDDIGLSYERYQKTEINSDFDNVSLENYIELTRGVTFSKNQTTSQSKKGILRANNIDLNKSKLNLDDLMYVLDEVKTKDSQKLKKDDIFICLASGSKTHIGKVAYVDKDYDYFIGGFMGIIRCSNLILPKYLYFNLSSIKFNNYLRKVLTTTSINNLNKKLLYSFQIPLPPLDIQKEIADELEQYQKVIDGAQQVVDNYKPHFEIDESCEKIEIEKVCELNPKKSEIKDLDGSTNVSFCPMSCINTNNEEFIPTENKPLNEVYKGYTYFKNGDVILAKVTPCFENGKIGIASNLTNGIGFGSTEFYVFRANNLVRNKWIFLNLMNSNFIEHGINNFTGTSGLRRVPKNYILNYKIPLPSLEIQDEIINNYEQEKLIIDGNKKLIEIYSKKIEDRINKIWGE